MKGRNPTKAEQEWLDKARQLGCIACIVARRIRPFTVPPEYTAMHHMDGKTKPGAHLESIPLCPGCHQQNPDARHVNKRKFVETYGTEQELLAKVKEYII